MVEILAAHRMLSTVPDPGVAFAWACDRAPARSPTGVPSGEVSSGKRHPGTWLLVLGEHGSVQVVDTVTGRIACVLFRHLFDAHTPALEPQCPTSPSAAAAKLDDSSPRGSPHASPRPPAAARQPVQRWTVPAEAHWVSEPTGRLSPPASRSGMSRLKSVGGFPVASLGSPTALSVAASRERLARDQQGAKGMPVCFAASGKRIGAHDVLRC